MRARVLPFIQLTALAVMLTCPIPGSEARADVTRHASADSVSSSGSSGETVRFGRARHALFVNGSLNADDGNVGMTYRFYLLSEQELALFVGMTGRFWDEVVRVPFRPNVSLQLRETRELWMAGVHKSIGGSGAFGAFADVGAGYTTANYDGVDLDPEEGWTFLLRCGGMVSLHSDALVGEAWRLEFGYQYVDLRTAPENWFYGALGALF